MAKKLTYKEFKKIVIEEFDCMIDKHWNAHITRRHKGLPIRDTFHLKDEAIMDPITIEKACKNLKLPLERFKDYLA